MKSLKEINLTSNGFIQTLAVGIRGSLSLINCSFTSLVVQNEDPLFSFINPEYDLTSIESADFVASLKIENCTFENITSNSKSSPVVLYSSVNDQNYLFYNVSFRFVSSCQDFFWNSLYLFDLDMEIIHIQSVQTIDFHLSSFMFNRVAYNIMVEQSKFLNLWHSSCLNNSNENSFSCFYLTNVFNLSILNLTIANTFSSISTSGLKIIHDLTYTFPQPYVSFYNKMNLLRIFLKGLDRKFNFYWQLGPFKRKQYAGRRSCLYWIQCDLEFLSQKSPF